MVDAARCEALRCASGSLLLLLPLLQLGVSAMAELLTSSWQNQGASARTAPTAAAASSAAANRLAARGIVACACAAGDGSGRAGDRGCWQILGRRSGGGADGGDAVGARRRDARDWRSRVSLAAREAQLSARSPLGPDQP